MTSFPAVANTEQEGTEKVCGIQYSTLDQASSCPVPSPPEWPPLLQIPAPEYRAVRTDFLSFMDLPDQSCRNSGSCPARLAGNWFTSSSTLNSSDILDSLAYYALGSDTETAYTNFLEPAFFSNQPLYHLQPQCSANSVIPVSIQLTQEAICIQGQNLWLNSSSEVNDELYKGYRKGNSEGKTNEIVAAYDFLNSDFNNFNLSIWYNSTYNNNTGNAPLALMRVPRSVNLVILTSLVYDKQQKIRIMMKMHGLGDGPYWMITYAYFLALSLAYMLCFVIFGSVIGLKFFTLNDYSIQFVFYFLCINLQISMAFLIASVFLDVKTAADDDELNFMITVIGYVVVFATGLFGAFLFQYFIQDTSFPRGWVIVMELYPGFSLYRGLYEFSQYAFSGSTMGTHGMRWGDLSDSNNGMRNALIIMSEEWLVVLSVAYYIDLVVSSGSGVGRSPLFFLKNFRKKLLSSSSLRKPSFGLQGPKVLIEMDKPDVAQEREKVEQLLLEPKTYHSIICDNLKKVYPKRDGNPEKFAVRGMSLALPQGECFGMLGPNGAGKTSFINMMIGLIKPSSGMAYVGGLDIRTQMDEIYTSMGVCPQHDLLWETLTGREHLFFYGRLKNLKGSGLSQAVEESLKSVNLFDGGVADKKAGTYSGGMKRRLSVAISLIGDPKVVYMDEPSTGLDPASRKNLWDVVNQAKQNRAIILTTHSMEEAEQLCDRLGIFVDGSLQCIGNPRELKARYGGSYVFTMTTSSNHEEEVERLVKNLSRNANKVYHLSGTQKFELPKQEVRIAEVFRAVEKAKRRFTVQAWGLADTTLEDVFIKVARSAQSLLWETLTGREHLHFHGRLKNLKRVRVIPRVADRKAGKYRGGMKRRPSVAISLIGDPKNLVKVAYMDEPSTGLDPASRNNLWNVMKRAKQNRAIILTTHSTEEAEHLCNRLGIFMDGSLQCIGKPQREVESLVKNLSRNANKIYHLSGTQKFELPKQVVRIAEVFQAVEKAKRRFTVQAWGMADTTLEDVFIKVARCAEAFNVLS
ncbi:hypothetical protein RHSIM_Rhsim12G0157900 [Rhododendron simsii]|uniref:ABC transporter domain-containing protein n=1 Tax=Rhododendron simsii TaxID=118357 RepID=A0A834G0Y1_RHOSS|nr:hypothetical protein RHSIM_Rhsim12G0157900 [Rhododendron simsii]